YEVERLVPAGESEETLKFRAELRAQRSRPIVQEIQAWTLAQRVLPESGLAKAIDYLLGMWKGLTLFLEDPRIPLDNNQTERGLRGLVVGRKNHYGSRSRRGTQVAALFYSLLESASCAAWNRKPICSPPPAPPSPPPAPSARPTPSCAKIP